MNKLLLRKFLNTICSIDSTPRYSKIAYSPVISQTLAICMKCMSVKCIFYIFILHISYFRKLNKYSNLFGNVVEYQEELCGISIFISRFFFCVRAKALEHQRINSFLYIRIVFYFSTKNKKKNQLKDVTQMPLTSRMARDVNYC